MHSNKSLMGIVRNALATKGIDDIDLAQKLVKEFVRWRDGK